MNEYKLKEINEMIETTLKTNQYLEVLHIEVPDKTTFLDSSILKPLHLIGYICAPIHYVQGIYELRVIYSQKIDPKKRLELYKERTIDAIVYCKENIDRENQNLKTLEDRLELINKNINSI